MKPLFVAHCDQGWKIKTGATTSQLSFAMDEGAGCEMDDIAPPFQLESDQLAFKGKVLIDQSTFDLVGWSLYMFEHHASCGPM